MTNKELKQLEQWEQEYKTKRQSLGYSYHASLTEAEKVTKPTWQYRLIYR